MTVMARQEADLAWDLVEENRDSLTDAERSTAYVHLGVSDYPPVVECVLSAIAREDKVLPPQTVARLRSWIEMYEMGQEFATLLARVVADEPGQELSA